MPDFCRTDAFRNRRFQRKALRARTPISDMPCGAWPAGAGWRPSYFGSIRRSPLAGSSAFTRSSRSSACFSVFCTRHAPRSETKRAFRSSTTAGGDEPRGVRASVLECGDGACGVTALASALPNAQSLQNGTGRRSKAATSQTPSPQSKTWRNCEAPLAKVSASPLYSFPASVVSCV